MQFTKKTNRFICSKILVIGIFLSAIYFPTVAQPKVYPSKFTVALDGSGDFYTIQEAVNAVRDHSEQKVTIFIKKGVYAEKVLVPSRKRNIAFVGENKEETIIVNNDYSGKMRPAPDGEKIAEYTTYSSYTLMVQGNDFSAENLTIINSSGTVAQAVTVHVEADRISFQNCVFKGFQDTLYAAKDGTRNYFKNCDIYGTTDFIFGAATAVFENCNIISIKNSYITAASTTDQEKYGFVFLNCKLIADNAEVTEVYLGRPWRPNAKTVFINTEMGAHIRKEAWHNWGNPENEKTVFYAEFKSTGEGAKDLGERVKWSHQLSNSDIKEYQVLSIFNGWEPNFFKL